MVTNNENKIIYKDLSYKIVGILFKVHGELGNRYQEKYYQRAVKIELEKQGFEYKREKMVNLEYNGEKIGKYFIDFIIEDKIVLELKAVPKLRRIDFKQIFAYLKATDLKLGIIANFRPEQLTFKRILNLNL